ncbi:MAG: TonB family protein [Hyphomicrobiales bacterium]
MKDLRFTRRSREPDGDPPAGSLVSSVAISLGLHVLVIAAVLYVPMNLSKPRLLPGAISVNLVSLPGPGPAPGPPAGEGAPPSETAKPVEAPKPAPEKPAVSVAPPKPVPEAPKPEVSLTPKIKEKKSLKEATKDSQKMIERAIERIEKKVNEPDTSSVASAIERLKKKFAATDTGSGRPGPPSPTVGQGGGGGPAGGGGGGGGGPGAIGPIDIYRAAIASQVERNWAFSPQLAGGDKNLRVGLVFKVLPNGEIADIRYTERSSNSYLDDSAYKAIVKSSPVAPHPPSIKEPYVVMAIRFTPEGIR